ncbi:hypothetical protein [Streptococcus thermophilus]|nr:hypothetical protein [Streptococcus thermophilus]MBZ5838960.1 hypothetical protein [Streptococcus thermophilus]QHD72562.1 hypothetical protein GQY29_03840 [Streptococcus thermophilus]
MVVDYIDYYNYKRIKFK